MNGHYENYYDYKGSEIFYCEQIQLIGISGMDYLF